MPNRILRDWTDSDRVNNLDFPAEVLFVRLIQKADDFGRFTADPRLIKAACFPLREISVAHLRSMRDACAKQGLITCYSIDGKEYLEIHNFRQQLRIMKSRYPENPNKCAAGATQVLSKCVSSATPESESESESEVESEVEVLPASPGKQRKPRQPDPIWDTVAEIWFGGKVATPGARRVGKIVRDLKAYEATPDEIRGRVKRYTSEWPDAECTPEALVKHWTRFAPPSASSSDNIPLYFYHKLAGERITLKPEEEAPYAAFVQSRKKVSQPCPV